MTNWFSSGPPIYIQYISTPIYIQYISIPPLLLYMVIDSQSLHILLLFRHHVIMLVYLCLSVYSPVAIISNKPLTIAVLVCRRSKVNVQVSRGASWDSVWCFIDFTLKCN